MVCNAPPVKEMAEQWMKDETLTADVALSHIEGLNLRVSIRMLMHF